ncbi:MAG TPA: FlgD immunoglobulin-like domain containing protein [bacterium]|nr:FlgD immunoglobulin-like domain containing protein [bacterium]HPN45479.1 FlgD immunoglobulin-like domain containing protein [bacterium]
MKNIKLFLITLVLTVVYLISPGITLAGTPHTVGGVLQYSDTTHPTTATWTAYITARPGEVLTQSSPGSLYYGSSSGGFQIQCAAFTTQWAAGETLHAEFSDGAGATATINVTLTNNPGENAGTVTLTSTPRQITIATSPTGLQFTADGSTYTAPQTFTWEQGSSHTINVTSPQSGATGTRYAYSSWSDGGAQSHSYTVPGSNATVTASFTTQYYLDLVSDYGNPQGEGWYNSGANAQFSVTTPSAGGTGTQYVFVDWTGSGTGSYSGSQVTNTVTMNNPITETADWKTQYYLTTAVNPTAGGSITPTPTGPWHDSGTSVSINANANSGYEWAGWSGDLSGTTRPSSVTMNAPKSVTANFGHQVDITVTTSPAGRSFTVDGTSYTSQQTFTWVENSQHTIATTATQSGGAGTQYVFTSWSPSGSTNASMTYTVPSSNQTVTGNFKTQYQLTVTSTKGSPTGAGWYDAGVTAQFSVTTPVSGGTGIQDVFTGWTGSGTGSYTGTQVTNNVTMNNPITETAAWKTQYYLTVTSAHGSPQGQGWYDAGTNATFSVTSPDVQGTTRYTLQNWSGDYTGSATSYTLAMGGPRTVTAAWTTQYYLTTAENPNAGGDMTPAPPGGWYNANAVVSLNTTVNAGYQWKNWSGDMTGTTKPVDITMTGPKSVTANYEQISQITINTNMAGFSFSVDGTTYTSEQTFTWVVGSTHSLTTTTPQTSGVLTYVFTSWSDGGARTHTYTTPASNQTVTATFTERREATLTMAQNVTTWGTVTPSLGNHVYTIGDVVSITATPATGFRFKYWSGDVASPTNPNTTVTIDGDKTVTAVFGKLEFTLTMVADPPAGGVLDPIVGDHTYNTNSQVQLSATPNSGYRFKSWSGNVNDSTSAASFITIVKDETVTAKFELEQSTLTISVNPVGTGSTTPMIGVHSYNTGTTVNLTATPISGYRFVNWTGDVANPNSASTSIVMNSNKAITANFEADSYTLTMAVNPANSGTTTPAVGAHSYPAGQAVSVTATPQAGYQFAGWVGNVAQPNQASTTVTMNQNQNVTANFISLGTVRITTNPEGLRLVVDGTAYQSPKDFSWTSGTTHTIGIDSTTQYHGAGSRFIYQNWSDGGATSHQITVNGVSVYTATFNTQYYLTTANNPADGGAITPAAPGNWYDKNATVAVSAVANTAAGYRFTGWSGNLSGTTNPTSIIMDAAKTVTAQYGRLLAIVVNTQPEGLSLTVDGVKYTSPASFNWEHNSIHSIAADTLKSGGTHTRYFFANWSDNKTRQHNVTVVTDSTFTAHYTTQYYLTTSVNPEDGGEIVPAAPGAWFNQNSNVAVQAIANSGGGYVFANWIGALTGNTNPASLLMDAPKSIMANFTSSDLAMPYLFYVYPGDSLDFVPRDSEIQFKIRDDGAGINLATLYFSVNATVVIRNGIDQTGGLATINHTGNTCTVIYDPAENFPASSNVIMNIRCDDLSPLVNKMDELVTFRTAAAAAQYTKSDTLGVEGGAMYDDSTGIALYIPENALTDPTILTISIIDTYPELPADKKGLPLAVHFGPAGLQFADSVTITIPYNQAILDSAGVTDPMLLKVYYYSMTDGEWITLKVVGADDNNIYVKVKEFCYMVYGKKFVTLSKPMRPAGPTQLAINTLYGYETSKVTSTLGHAVEYRFDWGDGKKSSWSSDFTGAHKWTEAGDYDIVAYARSKVDTLNYITSDPLTVSVSATGIEDGKALPTEFKVAQNYPNPFNPETTIKYQVPKSVHVSMNIYNINGQKIRTLVNEEKQAGYYSVIWNGKNDSGVAVASGIYIMQIQAGDYMKVIRMSFLK